MNREGERMEDTKIQWHPGFAAAMMLELKENREDLVFEKEYNLNTKPLEIDLLIIRKEGTVEINNEIGKFFRVHNIIEYKSPEDHLDIDDVYKVLGYASLYKSYGKYVDERKVEEITVTLIRERKPEGLFAYFTEHGYEILKEKRGIYHVEGKIQFPTQIIVTRELQKESHTWLRVLSGNVERADAGKLLERIQELKEKDEIELADSVLRVMLEANQKLVEEWKGDGRMFEALMEIVEPQIQLREKALAERVWKEGREEGRQEGRQEGREEGREEGIKEGIKGTVDVLKGIGCNDAKIQELLMEKYSLSKEEIMEYF